MAGLQLRVIRQPVALGQPRLAARPHGRVAAMACGFGRPERWSKQVVSAQKEATRPTVAEDGGAAPPAAAVAAAAPAPAAARVSEGGRPFDWLSHWYPVMPLADLASEPLRPYQASLWGRDLVLWADGAGGAHCFANACPHRLAPLSEGRVVGGTLQCSYHGWEFSGGGRCAAIPQLAGQPREAAACANPRACATAYPTRTFAGLLWVWPDPSPAGHEAAAAAEPYMPADVLASFTGQPVAGEEGRPEQRLANSSSGWLMRDIPYGFDFLLENVLDVSHIMYAHHGLLGRREDVQPFSTGLKEPLSLEGGLRLWVGSHSRKLEVDDRLLTYHPPCFTQNVLYLKGGRTVAVCGYAVPSRPGHVRFITTSYSSDPGPLARRLLGLVPTPLLHAVFNEALDGDLVLLHVQEEKLREAGGDWKKAFYMPAPCDASVAAFRRWWDMAGGAGSLPWAGAAGATGAQKHGHSPGQLPGPSPALPSFGDDGNSAGSGTEQGPGPSREQLLSRLESHTLNCAACRRALGQLEAAEQLGFGAAAVLGLAAAADVGSGVALASLAAGAAGAAAVARQLKKNLVYKNYEHH